MIHDDDDDGDVSPQIKFNWVVGPSCLLVMLFCLNVIFAFRLFQHVDSERMILCV